MNTLKTRAVGRRPSWRTIAVVTVVGLLGFAPVTANASDDVDETEGIVQLFSETQCSSSGTFCLWSGASYSGTFTAVAQGATSAVATRSTAGKSVWNRTSRAVRVYSGTGGTGSSVCYTPGTKQSSISIAARSVVVQSGSSC